MDEFQIIMTIREAVFLFLIVILVAALLNISGLEFSDVMIEARNMGNAALSFVTN